MSARLTRQNAVLQIPADGSLRLGVVADTHSFPHPLARQHLVALKPTAILHGGDIGELSVLDDLGSVAPVFAVRGNIDSRARHLPDVLTLDLEGPKGRILRILLTHIAVAGPRLRADVARMARAEGASLVVCGHSHVPFIGSDRGVTVFNPGSIGPRRFALPILFGAIELGPRGLELRHIDAETGHPWSPPSTPRLSAR